MLSDRSPLFLQGTAAERALSAPAENRLGALYFESDTGDFYHVTVDGSGVHVWTALGGGGGSSFPLKFVVDSRLGQTPPAGLYSDVETAITAANAATKPAVVQIYPGTYVLSTTPVVVSSGVTLMGMGGNPLAVTLQGALRWSNGDNGGIFNLTVSTPNTANAPSVTMTTGSGSGVFTVSNAIVLNQNATTPFALYIPGAVNAGFTARVQASLIASFTGTSITQENGVLELTSNDIRGAGSGRSIAIAGGTVRSYGDRYERAVQLGGGTARLVSSFIDASSSSSAPIEMVGSSSATLVSPYIVAGNVSQWISATVPVTVNASNVSVQGTVTLAADSDINFNGSNSPFVPQRVRMVSGTGVTSMPPLSNSIRHTPLVDGDALTLPSLGEIMAGSILYVQNVSATLGTTLTAPAGLTINGSATYALGASERAILLYDAANAQYLTATTTVIFGGDLADGSTPNTQTVVGIQTRPVASTAPTVGQSLLWDGTQWAPSQQPLRYIVDPTLPTGSNTPAGYYQSLDTALTAANAVGAAVPVVLFLMPGTYTGGGANFTLSRYIKLQGVSSDPRAVTLSLPVVLGTGATQAALANLTILYTGTAPSFVVGASSAAVLVDNCEIYQSNGGAYQAMYVNTSANNASVTLRNSVLSSTGYHALQTDNNTAFTVENTRFISGRTDTGKIAVALNNASGTVSWTTEDSSYTGGIHQLAANPISLRMQGDTIDTSGSATVGIQFAGALATINAGSILKNVTISLGSALAAIDAGPGGIATTLGAEALALPNAGQVGDFVRPSPQQGAEFPARYIGGSNVVIDSYARTVVYSNTGNAQLPSLTDVVQGTRILIRRDTGAGGANLTVVTGQYLNGTLNGTFAMTAGQSVWAVAYRVGYTNPSWEIFV